MKKSLLIILSACVFLASCTSTSVESETKQDLSESVEKDASSKNSYKGKGLVIAITSPSLNNASKSDSWIPQYFQDSLTGKFVQFSKMTVLDRRNELLIKAEQELSESGYYSEDNAVQIGQLTNAQLVVVGNIQQISGNYEVNFRVNDATTNEIKASSNDRYSLFDMQSGKAVNEIAQNLLEGLGIGLSAKEKAELAKVNQSENSSVQNLAKGAAAEKSDDFMDALLFYIEAENGESTSKEAQNNINNMFGISSLSEQGIQNIKAQLEYADAQTKRWNKIFLDLNEYLDKNLSILVYDFSQPDVSVDLRYQNANFNLMPGVKVVPDRKVLLLTKRILQEWEKLVDNENQNAWVSNVTAGDIVSHRIMNKGISGGVSWWYYLQTDNLSVHIGFYDNTGYQIKEIKESVYGERYYLDNIKPQKNYFDEQKYSSVEASLKSNELPEQGDVTFKVSQVYIYHSSGYESGKFPGRVMSIDEYNAWAKNQ